MPTEIAVLDDPANPLLLDLEIPTLRFALRTAKISYPVAKKVESDLERAGRTEIYGIYFDFDSAVIRVESEPVWKRLPRLYPRIPVDSSVFRGTPTISATKHTIRRYRPIATSR